MLACSQFVNTGESDLDDTGSPYIETLELDLVGETGLELFPKKSTDGPEGFEP
jgi:hypothetical protein